MRWLRWIRRTRWDRVRAAELEDYLAHETADNVARGMSPADAAAAARRTLGNLTRIREEIYDMNSIGWLDRLARDLRHAARQLRLNPGFAVVAIASLALGIGANTAIFQLLDAVRLRSLPVLRPHEIVEVRIAGGTGGMGMSSREGTSLTRPQWYELQRRQHAVDLFAWAPSQSLVGTDRQRVPTAVTSATYFPVLGIQPWRGRFFSAADDAALCPGDKAVVSYEYWQRALGGRELDAGSSLLVDDRPVQVVGVTPPGFHGLSVGDRFDLALPLCRREQDRTDVFDLQVMGRLRPGITAARATEELRTLSPALMQATQITGYTEVTHERYRRFVLEAAPAPNGLSQLRRTYDTSLWLLLAITGLVLLIACANIANLMLARATARQREIAVRLAIGASRGRLIAQLLTESALIAAIGTALALGLAAILSRVLVAAISSEDQPITLTLATDWRIFLFATALAALTCAIVGVVPAFRATRAAPADAMKCGARGSTDGGERYALQRMLVIAQIAVSLVLLVGAALFVRSFYNLVTFDPGFRQHGIGVAFVSFERLDIAPERRLGFIADLLREIKLVPGVENAASTTFVPLMGGGWAMGVKAGAADQSTPVAWVSPEYFATMDRRLLAGRLFDGRDTRTSQPVAVVNEAFLRVFYPGERQALGKRLMTYAEPGYPETHYEIVGVLADAQVNDLRGEAPPAVLVPAAQHPDPQPGAAFFVRGADADAALATVRRELVLAHPDLRVDSFVLERRVQESLVRERLMAMLSGFFGALAALLATIGLYGVMAYVMERRRNEVGIRLALGARPEQVVRMVMRDASLLVLVGVGVGVGLSLAAGRSAETLLFGLSPTDAVTYGAAIALLAGIAFAASLVPALRAARVDPMLALRED
jgi:predicted permease